MSKKCRVGLIVAIVFLIGPYALHLSAVNASEGASVSSEEKRTGGGKPGEGDGSGFAGYMYIHGSPYPCGIGTGAC